MIAILLHIQTFVRSLTGRMTIGMTAASILSLYVAERARIHDFERIRINHVVDSAVDLAARFDRDPAQIEQFLATDRVLGAKVAPADWKMTDPDARQTASLRERMGPGSHVLAMPMSRAQCFPNLNFAIRIAGMQEVSLPDCWLVQFHDAAGIDRRFAIYVMPFRIPPSSTLDPRYLSLILLASAILSFLVARAVTTPLRRLTQAARTFSVTVDPDPIPEASPPEVRVALETFNLMQHRVREGFRERTQILASVTHDLQTPLTRLRLRLEQVTDEALRERLIADIAVTQQLVRDGLELARSSESRQLRSIVDIDSILGSVAEDAVDMGADVRVVSLSDIRGRVKPNALTRCVTNLVENAVRMAGARKSGRPAKAVSSPSPSEIMALVYRKL